MIMFKPGYIPFPILYKALGRSNETALRKVKTQLKNGVINESDFVVVNKLLSFIHIDAAKLVFEKEYRPELFTEYEKEYLVHRIYQQGIKLAQLLQKSNSEHVDTFIRHLKKNDHTGFSQAYIALVNAYKQAPLDALVNGASKEFKTYGYYFITGLFNGQLAAQFNIKLE